MINEKRVQEKNNKPIGPGPIVYWMNRSIRTRDNWAILEAQKLAEKNNQPLIVVYNFVPNFESGSARITQFKIDGLENVADNLEKLDIPFTILLDETGKESPDKIVEFANKHEAGAVITDFYPLHLPQKWSNSVAKNLDCAFWEVDSSNTIPAWIVSDKKEFAAYTIRPKIHRLLPEFLTPFPRLAQQKYSFKGKITKPDFKKLSKSFGGPRFDWIVSGEDAGIVAMREFVKERLKQYGNLRNDANERGQSGLSPYLHYGMVGSARIALEVCKFVDKDITQILSRSQNKASVDEKKSLGILDHAGAFLEELIVRRELSDNFCFYEPHYDTPLGFPDWAKKSLSEHAKDSRDFVYTKKQFEKAQTHDPLWNACQREMIKTGKMHGYMRMYWAKKILEWTATPSDAMKIAIYLNNTYELDGRDPNGYAGIAWSIGGVHDRAWFPRKVFGTIRFMAESGVKKKFDVKKYLEKWTEEKTA